jgi:TolB-like protein/DNA-binding winged helix-turn-helix (wHTH) protein
MLSAESVWSSSRRGHGGRVERPIDADSLGSPACWRFAHVRFDEVQAKLSVHGVDVALERSSSALLSHLLRHAGEVVHKDTLLEVGWSGRIVAENTLAKAISRLRHALDDEDGSLLRVVHGYGYRLIAQVERIQPDNQPDTGPSSALQVPQPAPTPIQALRPARSWRSNAVDALVTCVVLLAIGAAFLLPITDSAGASATTTVPVVASIAVLPFVDLSPLQDQAYFADGLAEELLDNLSQLQQLKIAARTSSFAFRDSKTDIPGIGRALNVASVLEGSVRKSEGRVRVSLQLIDTADGYHRWSQTYDRPVTELFAMQDEITSAVLDALRIELLPEQAHALNRHGTLNHEAYTQFLFATHVFKDDETSERRSLNAYRRAVALDPGYVDAWLGLADVLGHMGLYADSAEEALAGKREALEILDRIIRMAPGRADLYEQRADMRYAHWWDWQGSDRDFAEAARLGLRDDPGFMYRLSRLRAATGRMQEALALNRRAAQLDPTKSTGFTVRGYHLLSLGRYAVAQDVLEQAVRTEPLDEHAHYYLGLVELLQGRPKIAMKHFEDSAHVFRLTGAALAHYSMGDNAGSERELQLLGSRYGFITPYQLAEVYAWRGEPDQAFLWLQRSAQLRDASFMYLAFDPLLDNIRSDPRFAALMKQVGLPGIGLRSVRTAGKVPGQQGEKGSE